MVLPGLWPDSPTNRLSGRRPRGVMGWHCPSRPACRGRVQPTSSATSVHGSGSMTQVGPEELEHEAGRRGGGDRRIGWIAMAAALAMVLGVGGWGWSAHRRAATAEAALAEAVAARDAAAGDAAQRQGLLEQAQAAAQAAEARAAELGQQVQAATAEANRLQAELAARDAAAASTPATPVAAAEAALAGGAPEPAAPAAGSAGATEPAADEPHAPRRCRAGRGAAGRAGTCIRAREAGDHLRRQQQLPAGQPRRPAARAGRRAGARAQLPRGAGRQRRHGRRGRPVGARRPCATTAGWPSGG